MRALIRILTLTAMLIAHAYAQNTPPDGCANLPLPTTPSGPTWRGDYNTGTSSTPKTVRITAWRKPCSSTTAVTFLTFEAVSGTPFMCSSGGALLQNGVQSTNYGFVTNPPQSGSFCGDVLVPSTIIIRDNSSGSLFNPTNAFTFIPDTSPSSNVSMLRLEVGGYNASDYGNTSLLPITGKQSGNWFAPSRNGEGFMLEIGSSGANRSIVASWYTYKNGQQQWIYGSTPLPSGTTSIQIPMFVTRGANFGAAFVPSDVVLEAWGTVTFSFSSCTAATMTYAPTSGATGTIQLTRILNQIDGLACP